MASANVVQIVSHGPNCLDGTVAAAVVARFHRGQRVIARFAGNSESDRVIQEVGLKRGADNEVWITDLSWVSMATARHLEKLAGAGARVFWIDHHRSAVARADAPEFKVALSGRVLSERFSAARLTFNYLKRRARLLTEAGRRSFDAFRPFAMIADDHDRWVHRIAESSEWALAVQTLGGAASYREIVGLNAPVMTRKLNAALEKGREGVVASIERARATMVERPLSGGVTIRAASCEGYTSEVAAALYSGRRNTIIVLYDERSEGVSLRKSADCSIDLSEVARKLGGGGHAAAAGFTPRDGLRGRPIEEVPRMLAEVIRQRIG